MNSVSILTSFSFGILSFLSPCVLPMIPLYISYMMGETSTTIKKQAQSFYIIKKAIGFILGFSTVFFVLQLSIGGLSHYFFQYRELIIKIGGIIIIIFGIHIAGIYKIPLFLKQYKLFDIAKTTKPINSYILGIAFAAGWTPCVDPLLASIIVLASSMDTFWQGAYLMSFYCLGLALPFLMIALGMESVTKYLTKIKQYLHYISIISGILMIVMGLILFFDKLSILYSFFGSLIKI